MKRDHSYDPNCPDCKPCILDMQTGQPLPDSHPVMVAVMKAWNAAPYDVREAFLEVTTANNRDPELVAKAMLIVRASQS